MHCHFLLFMLTPNICPNRLEIEEHRVLSVKIFYIVYVIANKSKRKKIKRRKIEKETENKK